MKRQALLEVKQKKLKASELAMAVYALLCQKAPEVLDPATADMERKLDDILSARQDADAVISALAGHAAAFNEKRRTCGHGKPLDVAVPGGAPSAAALAFARSLAERKQIAINPATLRSRRALSAWLSTHAGGS